MHDRQRQEQAVRQISRGRDDLAEILNEIRFVREQVGQPPTGAPMSGVTPCSAMSKPRRLWVGGEGISRSVISQMNSSTVLQITARTLLSLHRTLISTFRA
jgi:hypothetical protein